MPPESTNEWLNALHIENVTGIGKSIEYAMGSSIEHTLKLTYTDDGYSSTTSTGQSDSMIEDLIELKRQIDAMPPTATRFIFNRPGWDVIRESKIFEPKVNHAGRPGVPVELDPDWKDDDPLPMAEVHFSDGSKRKIALYERGPSKMSRFKLKF